MKTKYRLEGERHYWYYYRICCASKRDQS